jgi:hypothetical protein
MENEGGQPTIPRISGYLSDRFGDLLKVVLPAMQKLSRVYRPHELAHAAYGGQA